MYPLNQIYYTVDMNKDENKNDARASLARKSLDNKFFIWSTRDCAQARHILSVRPGVRLMTHAEALKLTQGKNWLKEKKLLDNQPNI